MKTFGELKIGDPVYIFTGNIWLENIIKVCSVSNISHTRDGHYTIEVLVEKDYNYKVLLFAEKDLDACRSTDIEHYFSDLDVAKEAVRKTIAHKQQKAQERINDLQKELEKEIDRLTSIKNKFENTIII